MTPGRDIQVQLLGVRVDTEPRRLQLVSYIDAMVALDSGNSEFVRESTSTAEWLSFLLGDQELFGRCSYAPCCHVRSE